MLGRSVCGRTVKTISKTVYTPRIRTGADGLDAPLAVRFSSIRLVLLDMMKGG